MKDREIMMLLEAPRQMYFRDDMYYRDTLLFRVGYHLGLRINETLVLTFEELKSEYITII
jgi:integrase